MQWHLECSQCHATIATVEFQSISIIPKGQPVLIKKSFPNPPYFQPLAITDLLPVHMDLPILVTEYK